jgi:hypothetical protein
MIANENVNPNKVWQERFNGLLARIRNNGLVLGIDTAHDPIIEIDPVPGDPGIVDKLGTFRCLIQSLDRFAKSQFNFFQNKLNSGNAMLSAPKGYTHEYAISITLEQVGRDLEVIERAIFQRMSASTNEVTRRKLNLADQLAYAALWPAIRSYILPNDLTVLTYLQKSATIRVIPYARVAIIGVPYTCLTNPQDFLAIPHEVGHYVYWHGNAFPGSDEDGNVQPGLALKIHEAMCDMRLSAIPSGIPEYAKAWAEETFADYYGAWVAGPVIALDFQDLAVHNRTDAGLLHDNGEHPVPALRPYIYLQALEDMEKSNWVQELKRNWESRLSGKVHFSSEVADNADRPASSFIASTGEKVEISDGLKSLLKIIQVIQPFLDLKSFQPEKDDFWTSTYSGLSASENFGQLYNHFESSVRELENRLNEPHPKPIVAKWIAVQDACVGLAEGPYREGLDVEIRNRARTMQMLTGRYGDVTVQDLEWFAMLSVGGWTEGPAPTSPGGKGG